MEERRAYIKTVAICITICFISLTSARSIDKEEWDHFTYAQQWPQSVCLDSKINHEHTCIIKKNVTQWTTHGLWPSLGSSETKPGFCNKSMEFDYNKIKSLQGDLLKYWPNLFIETEFSSFWKHEWDKHGTCCLDLKETSGEMNYFKKGLKLNRQFDILKMLKSHKIVPCNDCEYPFTQFLSALKKSIGAQPLILCTYDQKSKTQYIAQVEICTDKKFNVIACPVKKIYPKKKDTILGQLTPCRDTEHIAYPIIRHNNL